MIMSEHVLNQILGGCIYVLGASLPIFFIVFLILCIVSLVKYKKEKVKPLMVKSIVFGCLSGFFLFGTIAEVCLVLFLAAAIAHM